MPKRAIQGLAKRAGGVPDGSEEPDEDGGGEDGPGV